MELLKHPDFDLRRVRVDAVTPSGIQVIRDWEPRCPRCASVDVMRCETHYRLRLIPGLDAWSECNNCGWNDVIDPSARLYVDGSICTDWPF